MFGFYRKRKPKEDESMNQEDKNKLLSMSTNGSGIMKAKPRYAFDVKVYSMDENDKYTITEIQKDVLGNSEEDIRQLFAMSDQKVEFLNKRELNPPPQTGLSANYVTKTPDNPQPKMSIPYPNPEPKYFTAGGIKFKMVGNEVFQKQWIRATPEEVESIRLVNDKTNKILSLEGKHIEIEHWIKVESDKSL